MKSLAAYYVLVVSSQDRPARDRARGDRPSLAQRVRALVAGLRPVRARPRPALRA